MDSKESSSSVLFAPSPSVAHDYVDDELFRLSSARAPLLPGASMESYTLDFHPQQFNKRLLMSPPPCPPVAMSLRARESSAMATKHIFDQQVNNSASSREQMQQMGGLQGMRNQSMPDLRKRIPDLDLTFRKAQDQNRPFAQVGFGSPISTPTNQNLLPQAPPPPPPPPINGQLMQHTCLPQAAASTRLNPLSRQSTAQMTIFYSGNVNVYDDVPADKAHAIMLLAGNAWSSGFKCPPPSPPSASPVSPAETMMMKERAPSPVKATPSQHASVTSTNNNGGTVAKSFGSPAPTVTSLASPPPSPAVQTPAPVPDGAKSSQAGAAVKRQHAGIELPHARKASLARFLEKRKDRVQVQQQDQEAVATSEKGGGEQTSCKDEPDHAATSSSMSKKRSRSPSPPSRNSKENNTKNNAADEILSRNEHHFFH